jgi:hypothetical protein
MAEIGGEHEMVFKKKNPIFGEEPTKDVLFQQKHDLVAAVNAVESYFEAKRAYENSIRKFDKKVVVEKAWKEYQDRLEIVQDLL